MFSPILVIYSFSLLVVFARQRIPVWIKVIKMAIVVSSLFPLIGVAWFVIRLLCGEDVLPVPAD